jgi:hypothetical protein
MDLAALDLLWDEVKRRERDGNDADGGSSA